MWGRGVWFSQKARVTWEESEMISICHEFLQQQEQQICINLWFKKSEAWGFSFLEPLLQSCDIVQFHV